MKFDIDIGRQKCKMENENQKGESKMENENQKLSFGDVLKITKEICSSNAVCEACPFLKGELCIVRDCSLSEYPDEIEAICTEWEDKKPTLAQKINEILKPYGMKLLCDNHYIWFDDNDMEKHTKSALIDKLYTTKYKEN